MSHFTLIVVGATESSLPMALEPFDENADVERYKQYWDSAELEGWETALSKPESEGEPGPMLPALAEGERHSLEQIAAVYNERYRSEDEGVQLDDGGIFEWSEYNPQSKWDWYTVGGRWEGFFLLRDGSRADIARKGKIDLEAMRRAQVEAAGRWWDAVDAIVGELPPAKSWREVLFDHDDKPDVAREAYHAQPRVKALREHDEEGRKREGDGFVPLSGWFSDGIDEYQFGREEYLERARLETVSPHAVLLGGRWHEAGKMGWFGSSSETPTSRLEFIRWWNEQLDRLPDSTQLILVDCHI